MISVSQFALAHDLIVDERSVGRLEILDPVARAIERHARVLSAHALLVDKEVVFWGPSDVERRHAELHPAAEIGSVDYDQARFARLDRRRMRLVVQGNAGPLRIALCQSLIILHDSRPTTRLLFASDAPSLHGGAHFFHLAGPARRRSLFSRLAFGAAIRRPPGRRTSGIELPSMEENDWNVRDIAPLSGQHAIVTGANSGIGFVAALELARAGAVVTLACRDEGRGREALDRVRAQVPDAKVDLERLDLARLSSVRDFAELAVSSQVERRNAVRIRCRAR